MRVVVEAVRSGVGVALLPTVLARTMPELVPLPALGQREELPLWLVSHQDLLRIPRVRVIFDAIAQAASGPGRPKAPSGGRPES